MSLGGSSQRQRSSSTSTADSLGINASTQQLDPTQLANQQQLFGQFSNALGQQPSGAGFRGHAQQLAQGNTPGQQLALQQAQQGAFGTNQLAQFAQTMNPLTQNNIRRLGQDISDTFRQQILPGLGSDFQAAGQRGSSRQGVAEGLAAQGALRSFGAGAADIYNNAYGQAQQSSAQLAQLGQGAQGQFLQGQLGGLGAVPGLTQAQFMPFQIGAGIVGQPSTLTSSFGLDQRTARSQSSGSGSGSGLNIGFI